MTTSMRNMWPFLLFALLLITNLAKALTIPLDYQSGKESCALHREQRSKELEYWLQVPVDYNDPASSQTDLYAWSHKPFNSLQPTVIFVSGGPGETAHGSSLDLPGWNVIFFDQRGISCSKPTSKKLYLDPQFYSSLNTARDINEIRKFLNISQVSVYGVSYGTVPAHLYGHLFPEHSRAIVLEGVVFEGGAPLMEPSRRLKLLQKFFNSLPINTQDRILELSKNPRIAPNWFSNVGMMMLYLDNSLAAFKIFLDNIIGSDEAAIAVLSSFEKNNPEDQVYGFGHVMMGMIGCQELGMNISGVSFFSIFKNRQLQSDQYNHQQIHYCQALGFKKDETPHLYQSTQYLTKVPMTYIQGTMDGATSARNAVHHYKSVAQGPAQLILVGNGGHIPVMGTLGSGYETGATVEARVNVLAKALLGEFASPMDLEDLSKATDLQWIRTTK